MVKHKMLQKSKKLFVIGKVENFQQGVNILSIQRTDCIIPSETEIIRSFKGRNELRDE